MDVKPRIDFFCVGAAKAGTTSLYRLLQKHPGVFLPETKEPRFFTTNRERGWEWYTSLYRDARPGQIAGDFSPYATGFAPPVGGEPGTVPELIAQAYPGAKIVYLVRNPIDLAISNWRMQAKTFSEQLPFHACLFDPRWQNTVRQRALFGSHIDRHLKWFPSEQIKVVALERLRQDTAGEITGLLGFLGLPTEPLANEPLPHINSTARKADWPARPMIPLEDRKLFIEAVAEDALRALDYLDLPRSLWQLTPDYPGWQA